MAFHGTFDHTLDAKNRLTVPSKFRSALAGKVFLVKGEDRDVGLGHVKQDGQVMR